MRALATVLALTLWCSPSIAGEQLAQDGAETNEALFQLARETFNSASQPESIALFSRLIARLELTTDPSALTEVEYELLTESLYYRANATLNIGDEAATRADLRRLLLLEPGYEIERQLVSPKLVDIFDAIRAEVVGDLQLLVAPTDAEIRLDDTLVTDTYSVIATTAGPHSLRAERAGFAPDARQIEVQAAQLTTVDIELERVSAVLRLHTRPSGATVRLDGVDVGTTAGAAPPEIRLTGEAARYAPAEFSAALLLADVLPGTHRMELRAPGYRPHVADVTIDDLADYDLGAVVLEPLRGTLALTALPGDAAVQVDGREVRLGQRAFDDVTLPAADLAPGEYVVTVTSASGHVFESTVVIDDAVTTRLTIDMRPSIAFLGILGEDTVGADKVRSALESGIEATPEWSFLDRSQVDRAVLTDAGVGVDALRELGQLASPEAGALAWSDVQAAIAGSVRGSVYLLAVLSDDLLATHVDLWLWPAPPGPATPDRVRLAVDDAASFDGFVESLRRPFNSSVPYFGAVLVDSDAVQGPVVFDVTPDSPAGVAGLQPGDAIVSVGRDTAESAAQVRELLADKPVDAPVEMILLRKGATTRTQVRMESGPSVVPGGLDSMAYAAVWAASMAQLDAPDAAIPRWVAELNIANVLMQAGYWDEAVRRLRGISVPDNSGFATAMVDYQLGIALEAIGPQYLELAQASYRRAASIPGARLWHRDGPYLVPRALARLATLGGSATSR